jgi:biopolymer transport protein ExbD
MVTLHGKPLLRRKRPRPEAEMDITPMIDCTFLLLIFFLVTSVMKAQAPLDLPQARHGGAVVEKDAVILTVALGPDGRAHVYQGHSADAASELTAAGPAELEEAITLYVEQQANTTPRKRYVLIRAEGRVKQRDVDRVERAASQADVEQLFVAVHEIR